MRKFFIWFLAAAVLAGLIWFFYGKIQKNTEKNISPVVSRNLHRPNPDLAAIKDFDKILLSKYGKIDIPEIKEKKQVGIEKLPSKITGMLAKDVSNLTVYAIEYTSGKKGFGISYTYGGKSLYSFREKTFFVYQGNNWNILSTLRADIFAFVDFEDEKYGVRWTSVLSNGSLIKDEILIIEK